MKSKFVILCLGIAFTLLFFIFRVSLYETLYSVPGFSDQFYNAGLYDMIPLITIAVPWVAAAVYYFAINSVRFDRWWHWLMVGLITVVVTPIMCYMVNSSKFSDLGVSYGAETVTFEIANMVWIALMYVVASFSMRWWSTNCRHTPIPQ